MTPGRRPEFSPDGTPQDIVSPDDYPDGMARIARFIEDTGHELVGCLVAAQVVRSKQRFSAWYSSGQLTFNLSLLGWHWFEQGLAEPVLDLIIHELGHEYASNHLSDDYYRALSKIGARAARLALDQPDLFL